MTLDELKNFRQLGARTAGHPEYGHAPGIETTTGPLGQGLANAVGMALAERLMNARFGDGAVDHHTYGRGRRRLPDGGHQPRGRLPGRAPRGSPSSSCCSTTTTFPLTAPPSFPFPDDQPARFGAAGWDVQSVDGHDPDAVAAAIEGAQASDTPSLIACRTTIGYGAPTKAGTAATHGAPLGSQEIAGAREKLGWPHDPFVVPDAVLAQWRAAGERGASRRGDWEARVAALDADARARFEGDLPAAWEAALDAHKRALADAKPAWATRQASQAALEVLTAQVPQMIGGSADLTGSNNTKTASTPVITADDFSGRYLHYGVREHAMAAAMNGMALHGGLIPYSGTFLIFADYMRPAMRLSALMGQRVIYVLTHDSIGLGEDGPTHQPVETLASLRAIPNMAVLRPADAVETAECWAIALARASGPSVLALTRQGLPALRTEHEPENLCGRGAYVLAEAEGERRATVLATGSEVGLAMEARHALQADGVPTTVVSMPCWELFDEQDAAYRDAVLAPGTARVAVEAAVAQGWEKYLGDGGGFVGMETFGASAPAGQLYQHFGITPEKVVAAVKARL